MYMFNPSNGLGPNHYQPHIAFRHLTIDQLFNTFIARLKVREDADEFIYNPHTNYCKLRMDSITPWDTYKEGAVFKEMDDATRKQLGNMTGVLGHLFEGQYCISPSRLLQIIFTNSERYALACIYLEYEFFTYPDEQTANAHNVYCTPTCFMHTGETDNLPDAHSVLTWFESTMCLNSVLPNPLMRLADSCDPYDTSPESATQRRRDLKRAQDISKRLFGMATNMTVAEMLCVLLLQDDGGIKDLKKLKRFIRTTYASSAPARCNSKETQLCREGA